MGRGRRAGGRHPVDRGRHVRGDPAHRDAHGHVGRARPPGQGEGHRPSPRHRGAAHRRAGARRAGLRGARPRRVPRDPGHLPPAARPDGRAGVRDAAPRLQLRRPARGAGGGLRPDLRRLPGGRGPAVRPGAGPARRVGPPEPVDRARGLGGLRDPAGLRRGRVRGRRPVRLTQGPDDGGAAPAVVGRPHALRGWTPCPPPPPPPGAATPPRTTTPPAPVRRGRSACPGGSGCSWPPREPPASPPPAG
ncbi:hypothetical protein MICRO11B_280006 [Micrococcus luteus]|nr:hypothetical protein MICRO11B_280006 [Micrococcus luteus]